MIQIILLFQTVIYHLFIKRITGDTIDKDLVRNPLEPRRILPSAGFF
jgi:hypothetical protein